MIVRKTPAEVDIMARAGEVVASTLELMEQTARPGITTGDLDGIAEQHIRSFGGIPTFKGYRGFPGSICASPNDMIVHGIPGSYRLKDGDLLSVDVGVTLDGYVADSAVTIPIGEVSDEALKLVEVCRLSLEAAIRQCRSGNRLGDISHAVQEVVEAHGFGVVRALVGHGVGRSMHEDPQIPNYGPAGRGPKLAGWEVRGGDDGWAVYTDDGTLAAHCEHTVAITSGEPRVLTLRRTARQMATG